MKRKGQIVDLVHIDTCTVEIRRSRVSIGDIRSLMERGDAVEVEYHQDCYVVTGRNYPVRRLARAYDATINGGHCRLRVYIKDTHRAAFMFAQAAMASRVHNPKGMEE